MGGFLAHPPLFCSITNHVGASRPRLSGRARLASPYLDLVKTARSGFRGAAEQRSDGQPGSAVPTCSVVTDSALAYSCWLTESTFPSGSLNHATLLPPGAVQIPRS